MNKLQTSPEQSGETFREAVTRMGRALIDLVRGGQLTIEETFERLPGRSVVLFAHGEPELDETCKVRTGKVTHCLINFSDGILHGSIEVKMDAPGPDGRPEERGYLVEFCSVKTRRMGREVSVTNITGGGFCTVE